MFAVPLSTSITLIGQFVDARTVGGVPDRLRSTGHDAHLHLHAEMVGRKSDKGTVKRDRMARIWDNCNGDKVDVADAAASARKKRCAEARPTWRKRSR